MLTNGFQSFSDMEAHKSPAFHPKCCIDLSYSWRVQSHKRGSSFLRDQGATAGPRPTLVPSCVLSLSMSLQKTSEERVTLRMVVAQEIRRRVAGRPLWWLISHHGFVRTAFLLLKICDVFKFKNCGKDKKCDLSCKTKESKSFPGSERLEPDSPGLSELKHICSYLACENEANGPGLFRRSTEPGRVRAMITAADPTLLLQHNVPSFQNFPVQPAILS